MGMVDAFDSNLADFSGFDGRPRFLYVQDVRHKAFIAVDENGTEAAAATAVVVGIESVPPPVVIDRPFILLIRDIPTNTVLFLGRVLDPS
jgi:serpin B